MPRSPLARLLPLVVVLAGTRIVAAETGTATSLAADAQTWHFAEHNIASRGVALVLLLIGVAAALAFYLLRLSRALRAEQRQRRVAQAQLAADAERWQFALRSAGEGVWDWDGRTGQALFSTQFKTILGFSDQELAQLHGTWTERVHPEDIARVLNRLDRSLGGGSAPRSDAAGRDDNQADNFDDEYRIAHKDGRWIWVRASGLVASRDQHGKPLRVTGTISDITERKLAQLALQESEARYRLVADNTGAVMWMIDLAGQRLVYVSPSIMRLSGYCFEEVLAIYDTRASLPPDHMLSTVASQLPERLRRFAAGDASRRRLVREFDLRHKDGTPIPLEVVSTLIDDESAQAVSMVGVCRDITARRKNEAEQNRFVAMVSHEFRTPLTTIDGTLQRLMMTLPEADQSTLKRYLKIQQSLDRLVSLLDDYLTPDRWDNTGRKRHLHTIAPVALLQDHLAWVRTLSNAHTVSLCMDDLPALIRCDPEGMRLTLSVLTGNAIKYTAPGCHIALLGRRAKDGGIEFIVADDGSGIAETDLPRLFDKFFRGQGAARSGGSGLGLYMARSVVEVHGGNLSARNRPEGGAEFCIWLPPKLFITEQQKTTEDTHVD